MDLALATKYAQQIVAWLKPYCVRLEIAGSIRRQRPECADIDIVCLPKVTETRDLLGASVGRTNHCLAFLQNYAKERAGQIPKPGEETVRFIQGGETEGKQCLLQLPKCQLDLWFATEETFTTRLLCRTGSKEHNIWLCDRAADQNGHWNPHEGVKINGVSIPSPNEESLYAALQLKYIAPENREADWLKKHLDFGLD